MKGNLSILRGMPFLFFLGPPIAPWGLLKILVKGGLPSTAESHPAQIAPPRKMVFSTSRRVKP